MFDVQQHPFCNLTENDTSVSSRACEANKVHALLAPGVCQQQSATQENNQWDLAKNPFVPAPFVENSSWSVNADLWDGVDLSESKCLAGKAELMLERAFRYGFCNTAVYNVPTLMDVPDKKFGLQDADYYIINVVVWSGVPNPNRRVSSVGRLAMDTKLTNTATVTLKASSAPNTNGTFEYTADSSSTLSDLINKINSNTGFGAKAALNKSGHVVIGDANGRGNIAVEGTETVLGTWGNPIEGPYKAESSRWYAYNHGDHHKWSRQRLDPFPKSLRVYGTAKPIGVVAIHVYGTQGIWDDFEGAKVQYKIAMQKKTAANISDLTTAISIVAGKAAAPSAAPEKPVCSLPKLPNREPDGFYGATFIAVKAPADLTVSAEVDFPKAGTGSSVKQSSVLTQSNLPEALTTDARRMFPLPADPGSEGARLVQTSSRTPAEHPVSVNSSVSAKSQAANSPTPNTSSAATSGTKQQTSTGQTPTAPTVDCQPVLDDKGQQTPCKFSAPYDDENLYHWDVSFGVPFHALNELQYVAPTGNGNAVVPKTVNRQYAYAFADLFPVATDIKELPLFAWPHVTVGLPISGKVFNKPFFGAADGFNLRKINAMSFFPLQLQFYGGVVYNKEFRQIPGTTGASNVFGTRVWKGSYGVEIPVGQFKGLLGGTKSSTTGKSGSANQSGSSAQATAN